jgi:hypothetical protein
MPGSRWCPYVLVPLCIGALMYWCPYVLVPLLIIQKLKCQSNGPVHIIQINNATKLVV